MGSISRKEVQIPVEGGAQLSAWVFVPSGNGPFPAITMAHGYACTKTHGGLGQFAELIAEAGFVVILHDHRGFGQSGGEPRHDVDPWKQISDWRRVISFAETLPQVDAKRIGIWGSSYAGGHAIVLGATDRRLKTVVAQVPTINGFETGLRRVPPDAVATLEEAFNQDERGQLEGQAPAMRAVVSTDPKIPAAYTNPEAAKFYLNPGEMPWKNEVTLRSIRHARMYQPGLWVDRVSPTPLLMIVADHDYLTVTDLGLRAYEQALEPKKLELISGSHFVAYFEPERAAQAAIDWFRTHLVEKQKVAGKAA